MTTMTKCCNAYSTYHDDELVCKVCFENVEVGEGDGEEITEEDTQWARRRLHVVKVKGNLYRELEQLECPDCLVWQNSEYVCDSCGLEFQESVRTS